MVVGEGSLWSQCADAQSWTEVAVLNGRDFGEIRYGCSVACNGDTIMVGADIETTVAEWGGAVHVYYGNDWSEVQRLVPSDASEYGLFGDNMSMSGDTAIIGNGRIDGGNVYIFQREDGVWNELQILTETTLVSSQLFGNDVAIDADTAVVAAGREEGRGAVYVYGRTDDLWTQQQRLTASNAADGDLFGMTVALAADTLVVGKRSNPSASDQRAMAYVFVRTNGVWAEQSWLTNPSEGVPLDGKYASSVATDGTTILVSGQIGEGPVRGVFVYRQSGTDWRLEQTLVGPEGDGASTRIPMHVKGDRIWFVSVNQETHNIYKFVLEDGVWVQGEKLVFSGSERYPSELAVCGNTLVISITDEETNCGEIHIFRNPSLDQGGHNQDMGAGDGQGGNEPVLGKQNLDGGMPDNHKDRDNGGCGCTVRSGSSTPLLVIVFICLIGFLVLVGVKQRSSGES